MSDPSDPKTPDAILRMMKPSMVVPLGPFMTALAKNAGIDTTLKAKGICHQCKLPAADRCPTEADKREFAISGCCGACYDEMFAEPEDE